MNDDANAEMAKVLTAVGEPTRLKILRLLNQGPMTVGQIGQAIGVAMVLVSHHLGTLRVAGLVKDTKEGRFVRYSLNPEKVSGSDDPAVEAVFHLGTCRLEFLKLDAAKAKKKPARV